MKKAFTIIELLVAMGLLAVLIAVSAMAFAMAVKAYRTADASSEILVKLQAITDQFNADFAGLQKDMPLAIWCQYDTTTGRRYDQMLFFADGVFQSVGQYDNDPTAAQNLTIVSGAIARIYYGHADIINRNPTKPPARSLADKAVTAHYWNADVLSRRQHILTSDTGLTPAGGYEPFPDMRNMSNIIFVPFAKRLVNDTEPYYPCNDVCEYDLCSMTDWKNAIAVQVNADKFLKTNFLTDLPPINPPIPTTPFDSGRPGIDLSNIQTLPSLMAQGVGSFAVQIAQAPSGSSIVWFPSEDPNGDGNISDSDFSVLGADAQGFYFNLPVGSNADMNGDGVSNDWRRSTVLPAALKFTFTLYDSAGVFPQGKTFTHIVYIGN